MAQILNFFPKQQISGGATLYSPPFDISQFSGIVIEFRIFAYSGSLAITGSIEESSDPDLDPASWSQISSSALSAVGATKFTYANPCLRFLRAKIVSVSTANGVIAIQGICREAT